MSGRMMPSAVEAEASLLGTMMVFRNATRTAMDEGITADDFYVEANRRIFLAIESLYREGATVDMTTTATRLRDNGHLESVGGIPYLTALTESAITSANTKSYVEMIRDKALLRKLIDTAGKIIEDSTAGQPNVNDYLDEVEKSILEISHGRRAGEFKQPAEVLNQIVDNIHRMEENNSDVTGLATGYTEFDRRTLGLQKGDMIVLAARPSMGKTAVALNLALRVAERNRDKAVAIFSLEMGAEQLMMRLLSMKSRVESDHLRKGQLSNAEWNAVNEAVSDLKTLKIFIDDTSQIRMSEIFGKCRRLQNEQGISAIFLDYIQLVSGSGRSASANRQPEVSEISRDLKALAREFNVPVIALSQLSRNVESHEDKKPLLSDLRESGAIEQDADIVLMLFREAYYNNEAKARADETGSEMIEINIAKHRNGATGRFNLAFEAKTNTCLNVAQGSYGEPGE
ncbi:MAG: replicative DNA helicase [Solobacterium sp.]|nr:replicative DNA helicase [Solobacterium sp.]